MGTEYLVDWASVCERTGVEKTCPPLRLCEPFRNSANVKVKLMILFISGLCTDKNTIRVLCVWRILDERLKRCTTHSFFRKKLWLSSFENAFGIGEVRKKFPYHLQNSAQSLLNPRNQQIQWKNQAYQNNIPGPLLETEEDRRRDAFDRSVLERLWSVIAKKTVNNNSRIDNRHYSEHSTANEPVSTRQKVCYRKNKTQRRLLLILKLFFQTFHHIM